MTPLSRRMLAPALLLGLVLSAPPAAASPDGGVSIGYSKSHGKGGFQVSAWSDFGSRRGRRHGARPRYEPYRRGRTVVQHAPRRVWIPGHFERVHDRVWVPGPTTRVWIPEQRETRYDPCGLPFTVVIRPAHWETRQGPGHYESYVRQVWVEGRYESYR